MNQLKFSVVMSVYKNDNPEYVQTALDSIIQQTCVPDEIVLVADGPIPDALHEVIERTRERFPQLRPLYQEKNAGLGEALRIAVEHARNDYIARMDSDDISLPERFEKQMKCFAEDPSLSIVGGMITEFVDEPTNIVNERTLPLDDTSIKQFMTSRCGVNHVTVIFKKSDLMKAGNYQSDYRQEDYYLWARMMREGCKFQNIPDVVVNVRSGANQFSRRGGWKYFKDHMEIFKLMYRWKLISRSQLMKNYLLRFLQVAFPNRLRTWIYQHLLRG
ncbi:glycosyltransferase [Hoylesella enoeca]|uniref:glycosyltransferase n=1 Tax=Hoylesella enoeca TaxID=76123 RepID=UPI00288B246B|nr:glycosyltransferase [Hoylesella enoeca]